MKKTLKGFLYTLFFLGVLYGTKSHLLEGYFQLMPYFDRDYEENKKLVAPYFDEEFYKKKYELELQKNPQSPLDHFMQRNGRFLGAFYDPNSLFHSKLYATRLWPCNGNPFVDFLKKPACLAPNNSKEVLIYANHTQFYRAFLATEGFLRKNDLKVVLILPKNFENNLPICFKPQILRGLEVRFSEDSKLSFYKSPFLKDPVGYGVTDLIPVKDAPTDMAITFYEKKPGYSYLMHRFYSYTKWHKKGIINLCMLNFGHYC
ncbi:MAG TPA: hypothetical protein VI959_01070, partial [Alphaproteobacteria bacterium]|nr:hypothetical protein [Alphaproteobacteria bacterium]